ncbi:MAG: hypothetical protein QXY84_03475 [Candidatus Caldarchaeum sp.]
MSETTVQVCPVCGKASLDLYLGGYLGKMYFCKSCGYIGALLVEIELKNKNEKT